MFWQSVDAFLTRIRPHRQGLSLAIDGVLVALGWQFTYLFRLGFERWLSARPSYDHGVLVGVAACYLVVFRLLDVPKGMWRFSGFGEIKRLLLGCLIAGSVSAVVVLMAQLREVPRAVLMLHPVMVLFGVCGVRILYRTVYEHMRMQVSGRSTETRRALVLGAGDAARRLLAGIQHEGWVVVGLLDDDPAKHDARVAGVPVLGPMALLPEQAQTQGATHVIVAVPSAPMAVRRRIIDLAAGTGLTVLTVPGARELQDGQRVPLRDIQPEDLLGRDPVTLDEGGIAEVLNDKVVLVTGAGGSIGSELCRQIARYGPRHIVLFELSEYALYAIEQELSEKWPHVPLVRLIGDVKDPDRLREVFARWRPQIVFHAAAYKHVPLMEEENALAALRNNTIGTHCAARAAAEHGVGRFVLVSTDKAVNPTNVMGATKRAAELAISALATQFPATSFMAVRFGNVLGSSGSVIPKFKEQIAKGGPVTVTHPDVIRYFMTISEAARLVLQAAAIGRSGQVLVLDMGEAVKIVDMARDLIRLAGHTEEEIGIEFTGLRPGEKLYEELLADSDSTIPTPVAGLRVARMEVDADLPGRIAAWLRENENPPDRSDHAVKQRLRVLVPEFTSS
ncbi:polysaccharide biosynthesis protein [Piscinibacter terrae]|uniref:Polysaccharide biosynthesis protein n=1 Tax=Piscinibacter terrae TaxID=2496871 RepID=A0A3N7HHT1_9BURK|nr:nucleoside-diphosphate sugar epimerase/dehydratase [Albitalea terrae]RQP21607.1 polysaccharide biosynthesis protein [Albitalea terrae]